MLSSRVKISCLRAKAHPVFHWCLYNKVLYYIRQSSRCIVEMEAMLQVFVINRGLGNKLMNAEECLLLCKRKCSLTSDLFKFIA